VGNWRKRMSKPYVGAWDLEGGDVKATIERVETYIDPRDTKRTKPLLTFVQPGPKPLIANTTNCNAIEAMYGPNEEGWIGKPIVLFMGQAEFGGKTGPAVRVRTIVNGQVQEPTSSGATSDELAKAREELAALKASQAKGTKKGRK